MKRLLKSQDYLMKCLGFVLLFGFITLGVIGVAVIVKVPGTKRRQIHSPNHAQREKLIAAARTAH